MKNLLMGLLLASSLVIASERVPMQVSDVQSSESIMALDNCPNFKKVLGFNSAKPLTNKDYKFNLYGIELKLGELKEGNNSEVYLCKKDGTNLVEIKFKSINYKVQNKEFIDKKDLMN